MSVMATLATIYACCDEEGECMLWRNGRNGAGHPICRWQGRSTLVRRRVWELTRGSLPDGRTRPLRMRCGNRLCVNPGHIECVTRSRLIREGARRAPTSYMAFVTARIGQGVKLGFEQAKVIRADSRPAHLVAADYGCSRSLIAQVRRGDVWREELPGASVFSFRPMAPRAGSSSLDRKAA